MNAGPDVERLIAGWLEEEAPGRAPDRILELAGRTIDRTNQRRFVAAWRPTTMFDRLAVAGMSAVLAIGVLALGAFLTRTSDPAAAPCPAAFDESEAIDTFGPGLTQAQRAWGITGGTPGRVRPGAIAAYASGPGNEPLSVITIDPETDRHCRLVRFTTNQLVQGPGATSLDWSPAGDALAIGVENAEETVGQVLIWTADRLFRIWSGSGTPGLEWAPDGRSIAIWKAWPLGDPGTDPQETRVIHADGSPDRTYGIRPFIDGLDWSRDGSRWLVTQGSVTFEPTSASIVDVRDGRITRIDLPASHYNAMGWIDDGRVLLREDMDPGIRYLDVPVAAPADRTLLPIPDEGPIYESAELALSPDGRRVAYATGNGLAILDLAAGSASDPISVEVAAGEFGAQSWSPDSTQVAFAGAGAYWVVNADGRGLRQLVSDIHPIDDPWQPVPVR